MDVAVVSDFFGRGVIGGGLPACSVPLNRVREFDDRPATDSMSEQLSLNFAEAPGPLSGIALWREMRAAQIDALARGSGLPIGHAARVLLRSGVLIEGRLMLASDEMWTEQQRSPELRLQIGRVDFRATEVESCVRTD